MKAMEQTHKLEIKKVLTESSDSIRQKNSSIRQLKKNAQDEMKSIKSVHSAAIRAAGREMKVMTKEIVLVSC